MFLQSPARLGWVKTRVTDEHEYIPFALVKLSFSYSITWLTNGVFTELTQRVLLVEQDPSEAFKVTYYF